MGASSAGAIPAASASPIAPPAGESAAAGSPLDADPQHKAVADPPSSVTLLLSIGGVGCLALLVLTYLYFRGRTARRVRALTKALRQAADESLAFAPPGGLPSGLHELAVAIATFTESLRSHITDRSQQIDGVNRNLRLVNQNLQKEMTLRKSVEERLRHDALHDSLTQLPNRQLLTERLNYLVARSARDSEYRFALLFLDIDNFKLVNDSLGHNAGDELLIEVSRRLTRSLRSLDMVSRLEEATTARLGGDEFVIVLDGIGCEQDAIHVAERIQEDLAHPIQLVHGPHRVSASIGIAFNDGRQLNADEILRDADTAMYRAKQAGKTQHAVFDRTMHVAAKSRLKLENELRLALDHGEFTMLYQPIVCLGDGRIHGFEALLRWMHPEMGMTEPSRFIPLAEETGLIVPLGMWAMRAACRQLKEWKQQFPQAAELRMSVNVAKRQLLAQGFKADLEAALRELDLSAQEINLEVTESTVIEVSDRIPQILHEIKELGFHLHMDDFGTGYSSLSCLHDFPLDVLKIDRSFIRTMGTSRDYAAIVNGIMNLARNLKMAVVAEGIQERDELAALLALDCDYGQGYYFSRPVEAAQAIRLVTEGGHWMRAAGAEPDSVDLLACQP